MKTMIIIAHPDLESSRANRILMQPYKDKEDVVIRDLYKEYPDWNIDVQREHALLDEHERVVLQFPFYWYSSPPLLKKWFDDVFTYGWAFGSGGHHLRDKEFMLATTVAGSEHEYRAGGGNLYTMSELLRPIQRTITRCGGTFLPFYAIHDVDKAGVSDEVLQQEAVRYAEIVAAPAIPLAH
ncbi:NAD(P)H-dependent oxidoreductase [Paenibacillus sp. JCM 10914]|uniref:NAD(P)H-dependent oxidoreductase n=1 Tax=Paenibacillus sp. JCM 10914 TaxID=1236974 RepID=UPI0003CC6080|nr:NAD(P)H-dependent oxidoreductase [Paenibacillus sp. JCM 10914]GAE07184.1 MreB-like protein [Paenibacillus sp. JCM 10914]